MKKLVAISAFVIAWTVTCFFGYDHVITHGFDSFGTVGFVVLDGYGDFDVPPAPTPTPDAGGGGVGGRIYYQYKRARKRRKSLGEQVSSRVDLTPREMYEAVAPVAEAVDIVRPYARTAEQTPNKVNWRAPERDAQAVNDLISLYVERIERKRLDEEPDEEDELFVLIH